MFKIEKTNNCAKIQGRETEKNKKERKKNNVCYVGKKMEK